MRQQHHWHSFKAGHRSFPLYPRIGPTHHEIGNAWFLSRETLSEWSESAIVPAFLRSSDTQSRRSDYARNVISSAEELKARGNNEFKATRYQQAIGEYHVAIHMLEQFYQVKNRPETRSHTMSMLS